MGLDAAYQIMRARQPGGQRGATSTGAPEAAHTVSTATASTLNDVGDSIGERPHSPTPTGLQKPEPPQDQVGSQPALQRQHGLPQRSRSSALLSSAVGPPGNNDSASPLQGRTSQAGYGSRPAPPMQAAPPDTSPDPLLRPPSPKQPGPPKASAPVTSGRRTATGYASANIPFIAAAAASTSTANGSAMSSRRRPEPLHRAAPGGPASPGGMVSSVSSPVGPLSGSTLASPSCGQVSVTGSVSHSAGSSPSPHRRGGSAAPPALQLPRVPSVRSRQALQGSSPQLEGGLGGSGSAAGLAVTDPGGATGVTTYVISPSGGVASDGGGQECSLTASGATAGGGGGGGSGSLPAVRQAGSVRSSRFTISSLRAPSDTAGLPPGLGLGGGSGMSAAAAAAEGLRASVRALAAEIEAGTESAQRHGNAGPSLSLSRSGSFSLDGHRRAGQGSYFGGGGGEAPLSPLSLPALVPAVGTAAVVVGGGGGSALAAPGTAPLLRLRAHSPAPPSSPPYRWGPRAPLPHETARGSAVHFNAPCTTTAEASGKASSCSSIPAASGRSRSSHGDGEWDEGEEEGDVQAWAAELAALEQWAASTQLDPAVVEATVEQHRALRRLAQLRARLLRLLRARQAAGSPVEGGAAGPGGGGTSGGGANGGNGSGGLPSWLGAGGGEHSEGDGGAPGGGGGGGGGPNDSLLALASAVSRLPHIDYEAIKDPQYRMAIKTRYKALHADALEPAMEALLERAGAERQRTVWRSPHVG